uniref:Uncharacterized protein n=2 Tax=Oreochromis TaxID=8139 RepID=A0A669E6S4_ORENI
MLRNIESRSDCEEEMGRNSRPLQNGKGKAEHKRERVLLRHPSVQTTCSGSYWCTVVCTLVRLCKEVHQQREGESKGEVCSVETAMWDFSGQILEAGVWTKLQIFQPGMCTVPGRLPTTERGRKRKRVRQTERGRERKEE